jgi:hypothetical protein
VDPDKGTAVTARDAEVAARDAEVLAPIARYLTNA